MAVSVAAVGTAGTTVSRSPAITFAGYVPVTNHVVVFFAASGASAAASTTPASWTNPLGTNTVVDSTANTQVCVYRPVTTAEVTAGTTTYTATNLWNATQTGNVVGIVLSGVDQTTPIDDFNSTFGSSPTGTPHTLPGLTGANLLDNSLVVAAIAKDGGGTYTTPSGWAAQTSTQNNFGAYIFTRTALTAAGTDVTATSVTPSAGDEFCSITLAFTQGAAAATTPRSYNYSVAVNRVSFY